MHPAEIMQDNNLKKPKQKKTTKNNQKNCVVSVCDNFTHAFNLLFRKDNSSPDNE